MTNETEYGPEIVVDGVRPEWLRDERYMWASRDGIWCGGLCTADDVSQEDFRHYVKIKLLAIHPYYITAAHNAKHGTQFKYWPGGAQPNDYDGGEVLLSEPVGVMPNALYKAQWTRDDEPHLRRVIGYTPKPCATPLDELTRLSEEMGLYDDFVPCERTLRMAIEAVPVSSVNKEDRETVIDALKALLPKKDRAKELVEAWYAYRCKHRGELVVKRPEIDEAAKVFAEFLIEQGEIKG